MTIFYSIFDKMQTISIGSHKLFIFNYLWHKAPSRVDGGFVTPRTRRRVIRGTLAEVATGIGER
jgi:hypothetical protein